MPAEFAELRFSVPPHLMHDALAQAWICVGDSQTMAAEAALLGVPAVRCSTFVGRLAYLEELEHKYSLLESFRPVDAPLLHKRLRTMCARRGARAHVAGTADADAGRQGRADGVVPRLARPAVVVASTPRVPSALPASRASRPRTRGSRTRRVGPGSRPARDRRGRGMACAWRSCRGSGSGTRACRRVARQRREHPVEEAGVDQERVAFGLPERAPARREHDRPHRARSVGLEQHQPAARSERGPRRGRSLPASRRDRGSGAAP